jgi:HAD superfamily hydrolase (TIGR01509 family)
VSAELGVLKPDKRMFLHVIEAGSLQPQECVFFDDVAANVAGAEAVGMHGRLFTDALRARTDLLELGVAV